ncbi:MAG: hypothetical protein NVSMB31_05500 [Vulcanimicrobiaceae bacterium]
MKFLTLAISVFCAGLCLAPRPASADGAPIRHLEYAFSIGINTSQTVQAFGNQGNSSNAGNSDAGTIVLDVVQKGSDGSLVVKVSETAKNTRSAKEVMCAVYGGTMQIICPTDAKINEEEMAVLRTVGINFVQPAQFDAQRHWKVVTDSGDFNEVSDFTASGALTGIMKISETRVTKNKGAAGNSTTTDGTIMYNYPMTVPTEMHEQATQRVQQGMQYEAVTTQIDVKLVTDSMAKAGS